MNDNLIQNILAYNLNYYIKRWSLSKVAHFYQLGHL